MGRGEIPINTKARKSLIAGLEIKKSSIPRAKLGIFAAENAVPTGQTFGPYQGRKIPIKEVTKEMDASYMWELTKDKVVTHIIDGSDETKSNYMRFVNCARFEGEQNLHAFQHRGKIYYQSYKEIPVGSELLVWYGDEYAQCLGIPTDSDGKNEGSFVCNDCGRIFTFAKFLIRHSLYRCRSSVTDKRYKCETCGSNFTSPSHLSRHQLTHSKERPYTCEYCGKTYARDDTFKRHMALHEGEANFHCPKCNKEFMWLSHLTVHLNAHLGIRPYKCGKCGMCFTQSSGLQKHERIHTNERPYHCKICNKDFRQYGDLAVHTEAILEKSHTNAPTVQSPLHGDVLARHERLHTGVRPYKCKHCEKSFSQLGHVIAHSRIHTGERPFSCDVCGKSFNQKSSYNTHKKIHLKQASATQTKPKKLKRKKNEDTSGKEAKKAKNKRVTELNQQEGSDDGKDQSKATGNDEINNNEESMESDDLEIRVSLKDIVDDMLSSEQQAKDVIIKLEKIEEDEIPVSSYNEKDYAEERFAVTDEDTTQHADLCKTGRDSTSQGEREEVQEETNGEEVAVEDGSTLEADKDLTNEKDSNVIQERSENLDKAQETEQVQTGRDSTSQGEREEVQEETSGEEVSVEDGSTLEADKDLTNEKDGKVIQERSENMDKAQEAEPVQTGRDSTSQEQQEQIQRDNNSKVSVKKIEIAMEACSKDLTSKNAVEVQEEIGNMDEDRASLETGLEVTNKKDREMLPSNKTNETVQQNGALEKCEDLMGNNDSVGLQGGISTNANIQNTATPEADEDLMIKEAQMEVQEPKGIKDMTTKEDCVEMQGIVTDENAVQDESTSEIAEDTINNAAQMEIQELENTNTYACAVQGKSTSEIAEDTINNAAQMEIQVPENTDTYACAVQDKSTSEIAEDTTNNEAQMEMQEPENTNTYACAVQGKSTSEITDNDELQTEASPEASVKIKSKAVLVEKQNVPTLDNDTVQDVSPERVKELSSEEHIVEMHEGVSTVDDAMPIEDASEKVDIQEPECINPDDGAMQDEDEAEVEDTVSTVDCEEMGEVFVPEAVKYLIKQDQLEMQAHIEHKEEMMMQDVSNFKAVEALTSKENKVGIKYSNNCDDQVVVLDGAGIEMHEYISSDESEVEDGSELMTDELDTENDSDEVQYQNKLISGESLKIQENRYLVCVGKEDTSIHLSLNERLPATTGKEEKELEIIGNQDEEMNILEPDQEAITESSEDSGREEETETEEVKRLLESEDVSFQEHDEGQVLSGLEENCEFHFAQKLCPGDLKSRPGDWQLVWDKNHKTIFDLC